MKSLGRERFVARSAASGSRARRPGSFALYRGQRGIPERPDVRPTAIRTMRLLSAAGPRDAARAVAEIRAARNNMLVREATLASLRREMARDASRSLGVLLKPANRFRSDTFQVADV